MEINMRAFTNNVKKQLQVNYNVQPYTVTNFTVQNMADTIMFTNGSITVLADHIHSIYATDTDTTKAYTTAQNLLTKL